MERATHIIILTLISCFEIWMCYQILYRTVLEKRYLQTWQKILIWGNILGMGIVLGVNRGIFFLSSAILWLCIFYTIVVAVILNVKRWHLIVEIVGIYYLFVALLDLFFAFCGIAIGNDFYQVFSAYNYSGEKCILFILSRISIISILIFLKKERKGEIIVEKAQTFMLVTMGILVVIVTGYHFLIYDILNGLSDVSGWSAACSLLAIFVVVAFCLGIIRNLDILLSEKKKEANLENIRFQIEADVLQSLPFKETETSVLFGNLLDNAIEACKKMKTETRWIRVEIRQRKGFLFFTIANSIGKRPQEKDGEFVSDKEDR